ncbi:LAME_0G14466g1_1 [Lachancea meyersii CBS 8951]|uniref:LAME_0G14466g1_1 n=1 Tax=Lachancea meyersii CBS 8951 TaxID=1266667 RepID=A0A1G4KAH7_9SACH|nr:LAME_0G14466g1_1 [Lachancea meyersii CBS 8951]
MIIYDGEKYACVSCIRGHRSTTCKHSNRMLVKVRTKGRPSAKTVRKVILVDASSQVEGSPPPEVRGFECHSASSARSPRACSKMNKQPILFLRAKSTQKAFLVDGALKIVIEDKTTSLPDGEMKLVSEREYLLNHLKVPSSADVAEQALQTHTAHCHDHSYSTNTAESHPPPCHSRLSKEDVNAKNDYPGLEPHISDHHASTVNKDPSANRLDIPLEMDYTTASEFQNNSFVELFTPKGVYLSTKCNCDDNSCPCVNCLIHRKEEEIESYVKQSGVPLSNVGNGRISLADDHFHQDTVVCKMPASHCDASDCVSHPKEIVPFNNILLYGLLNVPLGPTTLIQYKQKLIPSRYWWTLLKEEMPFMTQEQISNIDLIQWFEDLIHSIGMQDPIQYGEKCSNKHSIGLLTNA